MLDGFPNANLIAAIFHFCLLLFLLKTFAFKHLVKMLEDRANMVTDNIETSERERALAEQLKADYEAELLRTRELAQEMIQKATKAGEDQAAELVVAAKNEAKRLKDTAVAEIQREKEKAVADMRDEAATLAILVASKIIDRQIDENIQREMVKEFVAEAGDRLC